MVSGKFVPESSIREFFALLNENKVGYLLIKNIGNELPKNLKSGKDIDIFVKIEEKEHFAKIMSENGFLYRIHPFGTEHGWHFAYQLEKHQFWQKKDCPAIFYIDVCFRLCCKSLTPKTWVPLDEKINSGIWENVCWNEDLSCPMLDEKTLFAYLIIRSVFDKRNFSAEYIEEIEKRKFLLDDSEVKEKLFCAFYKFTEHLISLVRSGEYSRIIKEYLSFTDY